MTDRKIKEMLAHLIYTRQAWCYDALGRIWSKNDLHAMLERRIGRPA